MVTSCARSILLNPSVKPIFSPLAPTPCLLPHSAAPASPNQKPGGGNVPDTRIDSDKDCVHRCSWRVEIPYYRCHSIFDAANRFSVHRNPEVLCDGNFE